MIEAIESMFKGIRYRSRMEARWAVFMDYLDIPFFYEIEAFKLKDGLCYLPDFYLPNQDSFFEIKSPLAPPADFDKMEALVLATKKNLYFTCSPPEYKDISDADISVTVFIEGVGLGEDYNYCWCECPDCFRGEIQFNGRSDRIGCNCPTSEHGDKGYNYASPRLMAAYNKAKGYRFDSCSELPCRE